MQDLNEIVNRLDKEFKIKEFGKDSAFSRFIPNVYDPIKFDWKAIFEKEFVELFNGLMLRGASNIEKVFLAVFPTDYVLEKFIEESNEGDLLFMHHPLLMECGDPYGSWGKGFVPINEKYIDQIKQKKLSIYTCHVPMDCHKQLSTNIAIAKELNAKVIDKDPINDQSNDFVLYCNIENSDTQSLITMLKEIFNIPYVDFEGQELQDIQKVAIVAGCGDVVDWMEEAERNGVQAYITGEIHCHIDNEYGKQKFNRIMDYASKTSMSLIGVSHSASEYLVHQTLMKNWFEKNFDIKTFLIPQEKWWL
ncbi:Nif3-like dinuclear metal center hexameric protein [Psychrobacillus sp. NPDC096389]|uniref:Nif3-like dinuclear metal center hexameric protein n=1 Tax=Psychrobacillus sp. NPDC096389 TaxID=3364490 RepID=UPI00380DF9DF